MLDEYSMHEERKGSGENMPISRTKNLNAEIIHTNALRKPFSCWIINKLVNYEVSVSL
jgi:hypothetical protein